MFPNSKRKNANKNQPRDTKGRFASWGLAGDGIDEAAAALEEQLLGGTTAEIEDTAERLLAAVNRVPTLTLSEARRISTMIKPPKGSPIPTGIWLDLDLRCRNASSTANDTRDTINEKRLTARAKREKALIDKG